MKRFAQTVLLRDEPDIIRRYEEYHANPWPEVVQGLHNCGVLRMFIYRIGRQLFMFMEATDGFDLERDMPKYMAHPRARQWDELMQSLQACLPEAPPGSTWMLMREIFVL